MGEYQKAGEIFPAFYDFCNLMLSSGVFYMKLITGEIWRGNENEKEMDNDSGRYFYGSLF